MDLHETQAQLELDMTDRGISRFIGGIERHLQDGTESDTFYGKALVAEAAERVAEAIGEWKGRMAAGKATKHGVAYPLVRAIDSRVLAVIALRAVVGNVSRSLTRTSLIREIGSRVEDEARLIKLEETTGSGLVERVRQGIRERGTEHFRRYYAKRVAEQRTEWTSWTENMAVNVGMVLLDLVMVTTGLFTEVTKSVGRPGAHRTQVFIAVREEVNSWVQQQIEAAKIMAPVYEPMVVPPLPWGPGVNGGYLTEAVRPLALVKAAKRGYLAELENADMPVVYAALNAIQETPWQINTRVLEVMTQAWKANARIACMPQSSELSLPVKPVDFETNPEAAREWKNKAHAVHRQNSSLGGKFRAFARSLDCAKRYSAFDRIYFPHQLDFRGRVYAVTTLSPQGTDYVKGLLRFAEGKPVGERGLTWLAIHGANLAGVDKVSYQDRFTWVEENTDAILSVAADPFGPHRDWWAGMDSPWQFLAFCFEWEGVIKNGENHVSHLPVAMDGSCSGLQHFSAMLRDPVGGAAVNLVPQDKPADVYGTVAVAVNTKLRAALDGGDEEERRMAAEWLRFKVTRSVCKRSVMTLAYGSKQFGFAQQIMEDTVQPAIDECVRLYGAVDTELDTTPWADPMRACNYLAKLIWDAVNEVLVAAGQAMKWLQQVARTVAKSDLPVTWSTPTGFRVQQAYMDTTERQVKITLGTRIVKVKLRDATDTIHKRKQESSVAPNFVHSCDASHLMLTVARGAEAGIGNFAVIHDSFGTHAADSDKLFTAVRAAMVEMYETVDVVEQFRLDAMHQVGEELAAELPECPPKGTLDLSLINDSLYCFA